MRVSSNAYTETMLNQFNTLMTRASNLQNQVSTGLSVQVPSDNPVAMEDTLNDLSDQSEQNEYTANVSTLQTQATSVYDAMDSLQKLTSSASNIATSAASGTNSQSTLDNYADQVQQLIQQALSVANTQNASGSYLFGGTASTSPPFSATTDADGNITGVTYNGNTSVNQTQIGANATLSVDVPGANTTGTGPRGLFTDSQSGADLFNHLLTLQSDLKSGNTAAINADIGSVQKDEDNQAYQVANNGALQTQLDNASTFASNQLSSLNTMISNSSSSDMVQTMVQLNQAQTAYQAALQSSSQIMQLSILNYLPT